MTGFACESFGRLVQVLRAAIVKTNNCGGGVLLLSVDRSACDFLNAFEL